MSNLKALIVGAGYMGKNHARVLSSFENVDLVAIADTSIKTAQSVSKIYKAKPYNSLQSALKEITPDFVCITAPTIHHYKLATECIKRGVPTLIEKPITDSISQSNKLLKLLTLKKTPVMIGHIERFNPVINEIRNRIRLGELGKIFKIHTQRFSPPTDRVNDVSVIVDLATHDLDILKYIIDEPIQRIYAETAAFNHKKEDMMSALIRFKNGVIGLSEVSWLHPTKVRHLKVIGQRGAYEANYLTQELFFYKQNSRNKDGYESPSIYNSADVIKIAFEAKEPLEIELQAFVNALIHKKKMPVTALDGKNAITIAQKITQSGIHHRIVR